jgi:alpha-amylase
MNRAGEMYQIVKKLVTFRIENQLWKQQQIQRYSDDEFYAFTRGNMLALFSNVDKVVSRTITYHSYAENTKLCNLFDSSDCIYVKSNKIQVNMYSDFKVYFISH